MYRDIIVFERLLLGAVTSRSTTVYNIVRQYYYYYYARYIGTHRWTMAQIMRREYQARRQEEDLCRRTIPLKNQTPQTSPLTVIFSNALCVYYTHANTL